MPINTYASSMIKLKKFWLIVIPFILGISNTIAQESLNTEFEDVVKKALVLRPSEFSTIKSIFRKYRRDTILMKHLAIESHFLKYKEGECYALNSLGIIYRNFSLYTKALENHKQAEELAQEVNNKELMMLSLNMQGVVYRRMDFVRSALDYHAKALNIANTVETPSYDIKLGIAVSQNSMGNIYLSLKQYDLALEQFTNSLTIEKSLNNKLGLAINYENIGFIKEAEGRLEDALKYYETSLEYNNEINSEVGRVICNNSIVQIYIKQKSFWLLLNFQKALS